MNKKEREILIGMIVKEINKIESDYTLETLYGIVKSTTAKTMNK